jgi:serine/threonine protein phosphatase 1
MQTYAIGDIHGHLDKLRGAHALIAADRARHGVSGPVVHLGDLVDRGPDSRGVIDWLMAGQRAGEPWVVLKGNHDRMLTGFLRDPAFQDSGLRSSLHWFDWQLGGVETLASYGVQAGPDSDRAEVHREARARVPAEHLAFIDALPLWHGAEGALFVHAGIRPGIPVEEQTEDDLVWIRRGFLDDPRDHGMLVVHGHTTIDAATHYGNRLNIDSGAAYGGPLSAVVVDGRQAWLLTGDGRQPLGPAPP